MNLDQLQQVVLEAARRNPPEARVPYAFEQRVLAQVRNRSRGVHSDGMPWLVGFWRAALSGTALALLLVVANGLMPDPGVATEGDLSAAGLEEILLASADPAGESW